jgi:hypothetical protein
LRAGLSDNHGLAWTAGISGERSLASLEVRIARVALPVRDESTRSIIGGVDDRLTDAAGHARQFM